MLYMYWSIESNKYASKQTKKPPTDVRWGLFFCDLLVLAEK